MEARIEARRRIGKATRERIVEAALETLKARGFSGTSARAIAGTGGFNQALIFYHFDSLNDLLLAALDLTSEQRMRRYRGAVKDVRGLTGVVEVAVRIYREDLESGHIKVLAELVAGSSSAPELRPKIAERLEPWIDFTQQVIEGVLGDSPLLELVPAKDAAYGIVSLYLGVELLTHLGGDQAPVESLFATARRGAEVLEPLLYLLGGSR